MKTKTHFAFRVDIWDDTGDSIVEHVAGVDDFEVATAAEDRLSFEHPFGTIKRMTAGGHPRCGRDACAAARLIAWYRARD